MSQQRIKNRTAHDAFCAAFTVVELLIVIAVMLFLLAMLFPGLARAREQARRIMCKDNLQHWGRAYHYYRQDWNDYLPTEGSYLGRGIERAGTWYNELPPYLDLPPYREFDRLGDQIRELPNIHIWICPSKNQSGSFKSGSGMNQFHYGMNQVLDGLGREARPSRDTPGFYDNYYGPRDGDGRPRAWPLRAWRFRQEPHTVLMFDIYPNSMAGTPRDVLTMYRRDWRGNRVGRYHGDYANILYLDGAVVNCTTDDLVTDRDFKRGDIVWDHPRFYWGYRPAATAKP